MPFEIVDRIGNIRPAKCAVPISIGGSIESTPDWAVANKRRGRAFALQVVNAVGNIKAGINIVAVGIAGDILTSETKPGVNNSGLVGGY
jgi:hypothetical protein